MWFHLTKESWPAYVLYASARRVSVTRITVLLRAAIVWIFTGKFEKIGKLRAFEWRGSHLFCQRHRVLNQRRNFSRNLWCTRPQIEGPWAQFEAGVAASLQIISPSLLRVTKAVGNAVWEASTTLKMPQYSKHAFKIHKQFPTLYLILKIIFIGSDNVFILESYTVLQISRLIFIQNINCLN